jgi:pimeloyl-ACP methyl ester carboxylesterase
MAIVKKDFHSLLPLILLACAVFVAEPVIANLNLEHEHEFWLLLQMSFYWLGYFLATLLMISALQLDPATSLNHDWLTRPIARLDWLLAKLLFLFLTVCVPIVSARFVVNLGNYGLGGSLDYAMAIERSFVLLPIPLLFAIALLTPTLRRTVLVIVLIFMIFLIPTWDLTRPLLDLIGVDISTDFLSMMWLQVLPLSAVGFGSALLVYWLLYCRRRQARAWLAFSISFVFWFFCLFPPASIYGWDEAIAIHKSMINEPDDSLEDAVILEHVLACFPAAPTEGDAASETADPLWVQARWEDRIVEQAGPGALTFATTVKSRDTLVEWFSSSNSTREIPVDWRIDRIRVRGRFAADSMPGGIELLRSSNAVNNVSDMSSVDTDYWLIPGHAVDALAQDPTARLILDYDLALLSPMSYELKTDGRRREFPELGSCRAEIDSRANAIEIDCIKRGAKPALVSAELVGVPSSRDDSFFFPAYTPDWLDSIGRGRYELTLESPNLVDSSVIMISAYEVERILHKRLETSGMLGGHSSICPLPATEKYAAIERSSWSDKSPHEVSSVAVEPGVRVEVLDWRAGDQADKLVLFLIPGLGGTVHSYDEIAPKLARKYGVIGMTRRGVGGSSKPDHGYDIARLSQDVIEVLDTLGIESPVLVGHSLGGEELSYLGANHPQRFAGLIYLDAAYDRTTTSKEGRATNALLPARPPPRPSDLVSYEALKEYVRRTEGSARTIPEGELIASYDFDSGAVKHDPLYLDAIEMGLQPPDYPRIPLPALAIYAVSTSPESKMEAWYDRNDPVIQQTVAKFFQWEKQLKAEQIARFGEGIADSEVLILEDADHWIFVSHEEEVLNAIDAFVERLRR